MVINLKDKSPEFSESIEKLKLMLNEKTAAKAIFKTIDFYVNEKSKLENDYHNKINAFNSLEKEFDNLLELLKNRISTDIEIDKILKSNYKPPQLNY